MMASFSNLGSFSYTSRAVFICICGIFLKHPLLLHFYLGSISYTSRADFVFMWGVSLTQPVLASFLSGSICYISYDDVNFIWGVSLTDPELASFLSGEFLLYIQCWFLLFTREVSLTHPPLASFLSGEFLLHIPRWFHFMRGVSLILCFYVGSSSYTTRAGFLFYLGLFLTHPTMTSILCGEFLLHIPCWLHFIWGVSPTHPVLALILSADLL